MTLFLKLFDAQETGINNSSMFLSSLNLFPFLHNSLNVLFIWYLKSVSFINRVYQEQRSVMYGICYKSEQTIYSPLKTYSYTG